MNDDQLSARLGRARLRAWIAVGITVILLAVGTIIASGALAAPSNTAINHANPKAGLANPPNNDGSGRKF
jgi:hypothetical protein